MCPDPRRGPRSVGAAMLSSRKTAPEKHQDLYMPRRRPSSVQPRRGRGKHLCASLAQARLRASALRRRRPGCLPQHTKRRWRGSGNSCMRMSIFIHRHAKQRTLHRQVTSRQDTAGESTSDPKTCVCARQSHSLMDRPLRLVYSSLDGIEAGEKRGAQKSITGQGHTGVP